MKPADFLIEGTDNLYHYAPVGSALKVLQQGKFELTSSTGAQSEEMWAKKGFTYYLSTTRSKVGDYHTRPYKSGVIFNLDGRWINQRYVVKPVDYWERMWLGNTEGRTSEAEDRVFSKTSTIPITPIQSVHLYYEDNANEEWNYIARGIMITAKKRGITVYLYDTANDWLTQNTRKALSVADAGNRLKGKDPMMGRAMRRYPYTMIWLELYHKTNLKDLSEKAYKKAKDITGFEYSDNPDFGLAIDLGNASRPHSLGREHAMKIIALMQKNHWQKPIDFVRAMIDKWEPKLEAHRDQEEDEYRAKNAMNESPTSDLKNLARAAARKFSAGKGTDQNPHPSDSFQGKVWQQSFNKAMAKLPQPTELITEARGNSLILVDFQPAYQQGTDDYGYVTAIEQAISYINKKQPDVTAFFNGEDVGIEDTKEEVMWHYIEHGLNEDLTHLFTFKEKSYAWLRQWMDEGVDHAMIIKVIRYLVMNDLNDSREVEDEAWLKLVGEDFEYYDDREMNIYLPDINIATLKTLSGSLLGGGGKHECLHEMQLLMNAFNIKYKLVQDWIYG